MKSAAAESDTGFILRHIPYRESSLLLKVFCRKSGLISIVAKGARRQNKNNQRGMLQPFWPLELQYGGGDLKTLHQVELADEPESRLHPMQFAAQKTFACASYLNEILLRTLHEGEEHSRLFAQYQHSLRILASADSNEQMALALRQFEWALLQDLGVAFELTRTSNGEPVSEQNFYAINASGRVTWLDSKEEQAISGQTLLAVSQDNLSAANVRELRILMQKLLRPQLGDKPLQSRKLWHHMSAADSNS